MRFWYVMILLLVVLLLLVTLFALIRRRRHADFPDAADPEDGEAKRRGPGDFPLPGSRV